MEPNRKRDLDESPEFSVDSGNGKRAKPDSKRTPKGRFWFDIEDVEIDSVLDSIDVPGLADEERTGSPSRKLDEGRSLDEGGMIVLETSQFCAQEVGNPPAPLASASQRQPNMSNIPVDASLGVFRAVEVATTWRETHSDAEAPVEDDAAGNTSETQSSAEKPVADSKAPDAESTQAASAPLWLGATLFFSQRRRKQKPKRFRPES